MLAPRSCAKLNMPRIGINQDGELDLPNKMYGTALYRHCEIAASQQSIKGII
jgi:hypothetical protein